MSWLNSGLESVEIQILPESILDTTKKTDSLSTKKVISWNNIFLFRLVLYLNVIQIIAILYFIAKGNKQNVRKAANAAGNNVV